MCAWQRPDGFSEPIFRREAAKLLELLRACETLQEARENLALWLSRQELDPGGNVTGLAPGEAVLIRDSCRAFFGMLKPDSEQKAGFSIVQALWDLARNRSRPDLEPGFYAEMIHMVQGIEGRASFTVPDDSLLTPEMSGREAAVARSGELDRIWEEAETRMARFVDGLSDEAIERRERRKERILHALGGRPEDWNDWTWHVGNSLIDAERIAEVVELTDSERRSLLRARACKLPVGITPFYASLMDESASGRDRAIRAQVLPPSHYVMQMEKHRDDRKAFDFMDEQSTSPIDLVTRRYPSILILKPYNTCPQICVYCQRNWEIEEAMAPAALAPWESIEEAIGWIEAHPSIHEVLVTGGDPLTLDDEAIRKIFDRLARVDNLDLIRIGSRLPVTVPMRFTEKLVDYLGSLRRPGRREVCLVTHVQHPYEINPDMVKAIDRLKRRGISVFNQQVYNFFVSRRFESARLRMLLRRIGIDPYYTFVTKGKEETNDYRVPIARLLQESKEEVRLLPGLRRTDDMVFNVPRLGKNYVRAFQHRDLLAIRPGGERVYEFHPWEKHIIQREGYVGSDVGILDYLNRLAAIGEDPDDYKSIWYYY